MKHILIAGDSLPMVRPTDGIRLADTYAYRLQMRFGSALYVNNGSIRANDSRTIISETYFEQEYVVPTAPDHVILHIGIVDCTPRLFGPLERKILSVLTALPVLGYGARRLIKYRSDRRYDFTQKRSFSFVPLEEFSGNVRRFFEKLRALNKDCKLAAVEIACPHGMMVDRNYGILGIVDRYNEELRRVISEFGGRTVPFFRFTQENPRILLKDGYHITAEGHEFLFKELAELVAADLRLPGEGA